MNQVHTIAEVLTLEDAAAFLRVPPETVERLAGSGEIPGRRVEGAWRFLHSALEDWLRHKDQRSVLLAQAGALAQDESLDTLLARIYERRGRPEVEPDGER